MDQFGEALPRALAQIRELSILTIAVSMDVESFQETRRISEGQALILPSFGIHPWEAPRYAENLPLLDSFIEEAPVIGEIGLDHFFVEDAGHYPAQDRVFAYCLDAAERQGKIVNIHSKGAELDVLAHLQERALPGIILHWYSGPLDLVEEFLILGAYFTIGVEMLRSPHIQELCRILPGHRLLTETDNPGGWEWMEGEKGFPELLSRVESAVARVRGTDRGHLSDQVTNNISGLLTRCGVDPPV
jgi:TatD DNase family protein